MNVSVEPPLATMLALRNIRTDGGTQPRASIYQNVVDDYAEAVSNGVAFPPVTAFYDGTDYWLADGFHRHAAYKQAGASAIPADIQQGTRRDAVLYSVGANQSHGLRRTNEDKRRAVVTLLNDAEWGKWSDREIARKCGTTHPFVSQLRASLVTVTSEPRTYTTKHGTIATMNTANIGRPAVTPYDPVQAREIIDQAKVIASTDSAARHDLLGDLPSLDNKPHVRGTLGTGENEWYTPTQYLEAARSVLGYFDVDPASSKHAQKTVAAKHYFTEADNGLSKQWLGNVWLNPPYAQPHIENFADKMISERAAGHVKAAIMLTHNYTDTAWFQKLAGAADAVCFTRGRIRFESPTGELAAPTQGQAFFYFGADMKKFAKIFGGVGFVVSRV